MPINVRYTRVIDVHLCGVWKGNTELAQGTISITYWENKIFIDYLLYNFELSILIFSQRHSRKIREK